MSHDLKDKVLKKFIHKLDPIFCPYLKNNLCGTSQCCWYCIHLPECVEHWKVKKYDCPLYMDNRWCSLVYMKYYGISKKIDC